MLISYRQGSNILDSHNHGNNFCSIQYRRKHYFPRLNLFDLFIMGAWCQKVFQLLLMLLFCQSNSSVKDVVSAFKLLLLTSVPFCYAQLTCRQHKLFKTIARWDDVLAPVATESIRLHFNWALVQFEDMNSNIMGSASLFVTDSEAEYIHIEYGVMTTLTLHFLYSCRRILQQALFSTTEAFLKWHFSLSRTKSAHRQINVKPKVRCYSWTLKTIK